jgi:hypothetical protein
MTDPKRTRTIAAAGLIGIASGALAALVVETVGEFRVAPGAVYGLAAGFTLARAKVLTMLQGGLYVVASALAYAVAVQVALAIHQPLNDAMWQVGLIAGLCGSAILTTATAAMLPSVKRPRPYLALLAIGCGLGSLLGLVDYSWGSVALYSGWQGGYAAVLAAFLPANRRVSSPTGVEAA